MRFTISWSNYLTAYKVSIPNYEGGEVVTAYEYDRLANSLRAIASADNYYDIDTARTVARVTLQNARDKEGD